LRVFPSILNPKLFNSVAVDHLSIFSISLVDAVEDVISPGTTTPSSAPISGVREFHGSPLKSAVGKSPHVSIMYVPTVIEKPKGF
jgi:hypothetical protein